jgi:hypothetical protein
LAKKIKYRSGAEAKFAEYLKKQKIKFKYEPYPLVYEVKELKKYWLDFQLISPYLGKYGPEDILIEFKGRFTAADRKKLLRVQNDNPFHEIRLVFQQDNKLSKKSKTKYSDWAKKNGFKYHVGISLPKEWLEELR